MKKLFFLIIAASLFVLQGCEDYLDKTPESEGLTGEDVFTNYLNFRQFNDGIYDDMHNYLAGNDQSTVMALTDIGFTKGEWETLPVLKSGNWLRGYDLGDALQFYIWEDAWQAIRIANISIKNIPQLEGNATSTQVDHIKGQAHLMRAWWYFEILRRQGGMPYITKPLQPTDNFALPRLSYYETAKQIAADCDTAMALLPDEWNQANIGRPTVGTAMAIKATALLFAASPTNNPSGDVDRWKEAANASWAFLDYAQTTGRYGLLPSQNPTTLEYMTPSGPQTITYNTGRDSVFMYNTTNKEIIWEHYGSINSSPYTTFGVPSLTNRSRISGYSPSQNFVDMFETKNGLDIEDDSNYNPDNPYVNRDPRFYQTILFNRRKWAGNRYLELWNGGRERTGEQYYSYTGYLSNKYWPSYVHNQSGASPPQTHTIYLRYAGLLLQYAEAANEIGGPNYAVPGASMTALEAVNKVRARVGMPGVDSRYLSSKEEFRKRIKNERAVELFFEQKRFFDLKRWGDAHLTKHKEVYSANIEPASSEPTGYRISRSTQPYFINTFQQRHYRFPIPPDDAILFEEFEQNPGW